MKRIFDFSVALIVLFFLSPLLMLLWLLIRINMGSPVVFKQVRPGLGGKPFQMYKFRSMSNATNQHGELLPNEQRITRLGKALRSSSLDELPGLLQRF